jgi:phosphatidylglycerol:prolipoprotein diacylglycerol transferase
MRPVLFHLGEASISSYWTMAFLAFFAGFLVIRRGLARRGCDVHLAYDITLWAYVGGWVGARLFIVPTGWSYFVHDPLSFLLSSSGWVWYGGVIGGAVAVALWARRAGLAFLFVGDIVAPALALGLAIGRIGCQLAGDGDYGIPTDLPWGMSYPHGVVPTLQRVHPTPLYEMILNLIIFAVLWRQQRPGRHDGSLLGQYLVYSAAARFGVEFLRRNPAWLVGLTTAQWMSVGAAVLGAVLVWRARRAGRVSNPLLAAELVDETE